MSDNAKSCRPGLAAVRFKPGWKVGNTALVSENKAGVVKDLGCVSIIAPMVAMGLRCT